MVEGPFTKTGSHYHTELCLFGGVYEFDIHDDAGDGLCCCCGEGNYTLMVGDSVLRSGSVFLEDESIEFSIAGPTEMPTSIPSLVPSYVPSDAPSNVPSELPSGVPSELPSDVPSDVPSNVPFDVPSDVPFTVPIELPSDSPSDVPSTLPSISQVPSFPNRPSGAPS